MNIGRLKLKTICKGLFFFFFLLIAIISVSEFFSLSTLSFKTAQRDGMGREEGGGFKMGNTCIPVADSF